MSNFNQDLLEEGRRYLVNAVLAYGEGFGVLAPEQIDDSLMEALDEGISALEATMPVLIATWELSNKLTGADQTFIEFLEDVAEKKFGGGAD